MMSLGTGALQVGRGPEHYRHSKEVSRATLQAEPPKLTGSPRCLERGGVSKQGDTEPPNYPQTIPKHRRISTRPRKQEGKQQKHTYREE